MHTTIGMIVRAQPYVQYGGLPTFAFSRCPAEQMQDRELGALQSIQTVMHFAAAMADMLFRFTIAARM